MHSRNLRRGAVAGACLLLAAVVLALSGCGSDLTWKTKDITNVMPDLKFTLTDDNGQTVTAKDYRGKVKLLYFGYTHCPDVCPMTLAVIGQALRDLGDQAQDAEVLFVSVDPERDTPKVLKRYAGAFGPDFTGLTGTEPQLRTLSKRYRVSYSYEKPDGNGNYAVNHSSAVFVFDRDGHVRLLMNETDGKDAIAHDLRQLIAQG